jgi:hypothetical protein
MKRWILTAVLVTTIVTGCALFKPIPQVGDPKTNPVTGKVEPATVDDVLAAIAVMDAELEALQIAADGANANPWIAGTTIASTIAAMGAAKRRRLEVERQKLLQSLKDNSVEPPEGISLG